MREHRAGRGVLGDHLAQMIGYNKTFENQNPGGCDGSQTNCETIGREKIVGETKKVFGLWRADQAGSSISKTRFAGWILFDVSSFQMCQG